MKVKKSTSKTLSQPALIFPITTQPAPKWLRAALKRTTFGFFTQLKFCYLIVN
jgi:hypothetical protein